jgi:hypothetical protein
LDGLEATFWEVLLLLGETGNVRDWVRVFLKFWRNAMRPITAAPMGRGPRQASPEERESIAKMLVFLDLTEDEALINIVYAALGAPEGGVTDKAAHNASIIGRLFHRLSQCEVTWKDVGATLRRILERDARPGTNVERYLEMIDDADDEARRIEGLPRNPPGEAQSTLR